MAARVDEESCTGCGVCIEVCPVNAISLQDGKARVDADTCIECDVCAGECPTQAIRLS